MLSRQTVFVIGAGASHELDLPLGDDLKKEIAELLNITFPDGHSQQTGDYQIKQILQQLSRDAGYASINPLLQKCWLIRDALPGSLSIDNLLDAHRNDAEIAAIGKFAIAKSILQAERASKLFNQDRPHEKFNLRDVSGTWLIPLFQILTENVAREDIDDLFENASFIVFNYDRCLEYFLPRALEIYYGLTTQRAEQVAGKAQIIHPYGRVGEFDKGEALATVSFGADRFDLRNVAEGIRTFSEGLKFESHRDEISALMSGSEQIVFLGFAFHPLNMEILDPRSRTICDKVFGTTLKLSDAAVRSVERRALEVFRKRPPGASFDPEEDFPLSELNLESRTAADFLFAHFRGIT